jgi:hypothetical protein
MRRAFCTHARSKANALGFLAFMSKYACGIFPPFLGGTTAVAVPAIAIITAQTISRLIVNMSIPLLVCYFRCKATC